MAFQTSLEMTANGVAKINLAGKLDAGTANQFKEIIEEAAARDARRIVLMAQELEFMASAGLRVLVFTKQKLGSPVDLYVIGAQEQVVETMEMTGLNHSVIMMDYYDADKVEVL